MFMSLQGAAVLTMSDFTAHTCLAVGSLYSKEEMFATHVLSSKVSGVNIVRNT